MDTVTIDGVELTLSKPIPVKKQWIGQEEVLMQLLACWMTATKDDLPLTPRIVGPPGLGKTTLAMTAAAKIEREVYVFQCTADARPEDLLVTPVLGQNNQIHYHASPLLSAVIKGGVAVLDEGNRMSEKTWASLASLLDDRRVVESIVAGIHIPAHLDFRCAVTMNDDSSTYEIPDYIMSRLQPAIEIEFPSEEEELEILRYNLPEFPEELVRICVGYLQQAHELDLPYSIRDGINAIRYSHRLQKYKQLGWDKLFNQAISQILGDEALDLDALADKLKSHGFSQQKSQLGSFFFEEEDPLNPDIEKI